MPRKQCSIYVSLNQFLIFKTKNMLKIVICALLLSLFLGVVYSATVCEADRDCGADECCIEYFPYYKRCKDKPDDPGDICLGQFNCDCKTGLVCDLHPPSLYNRLKLGNGVCRKR